MRVVFMGSPDFAVPALNALIGHHDVALVVTQPDKRAGRGKKLKAPAVKRAALAAGIPVLQPTSARGPELLEAMQASNAALAVVVAYGKILPPAVLDALPRGCLNIHGSLLPKYRGAAPIQWAVINGEAETGVSIMQLDEGMDTGPVFLERQVKIGSAETAGELFERLAPVGAEALLETLAAIERGSAEAVPQDESLSSHAPMLSKDDGVVNWLEDAGAVASRIRGVDPWPGARTTLDGNLLKLFGAHAIEGESRVHPGEVLSVDNDGVAIACGRGVCVVHELQAAGRKRMLASVFAGGRSLEPGTVLGAVADAANEHAAPNSESGKP